MNTNSTRFVCYAGAALVLSGVALWADSAAAQLLAMTSTPGSGLIGGTAYDRGAPAITADDAGVPARLRRQVVDYPTAQAPGTIVIDTPNTYLYFVLGGSRAIRYGIGVGRAGFTWSGTKIIERKSQWPDWLPPAEMLARQPYLPRFMAGGPGNPLGARAMYLGGTVYRIHGTNKPSSIGRRVSSGCIRMLNADVIDLYDRAPVGTKVVVLPMDHRRIAVARRVPATIARPRAASFAPSLR